MKKTLTTTLLIWAVLSSFAQLNRAFIPEELFDHIETNTFQFPENLLEESERWKMAQLEGEFTDDFLGNTYHDLQTLGAHRQQIYEYPDGYTATVWTKTDYYLNYTFDNVIPGTIYNYKTQDNEEWLPIEGNASKIEDMYSRFPSYAPYGESGEVIASQQNNGINIYTRPNRGEGEWEHHLLEPSDGVPSLKYPHMVTSGMNHEYIHVVAVTDTLYNGQKSALLYFRSQDGGQTWDKHNIILDGTGPDSYTAIHADNYCWAVKDNKLALVVSSPWLDMFYLESEDNGDSWEKNMVWEHPYPMFDFEATIIENTVWSPDGSLDAIYDETGKLHLTFGLARVKHPETGYDYIYFPWTDGIVYWNESFDPFEATNQHLALSYDHLEVNKTLAGWAIDTDSNNVFDYTENSILPRYPYLGLSSVPSLSYNHENHTIYLSYLSGNEYRMCYDYHYRSPYIKACFYNPEIEEEWLWGATLAPYNVEESPIVNEEFFYPQLSPVNYGTGHLFTAHHFRVHLYYIHGSYSSRIDAVEFTHSPNWPPNPLIETGWDANLPKQEEWKVSPNHPNPFSGQTRIEVKLPGAMLIELKVRDLEGKSVFTRSIRGHLGNNPISIPAGNLKSGVYLYTITAGEETITRKMMVK